MKSRVICAAALLSALAISPAVAETPDGAVAALPQRGEAPASPGGAHPFTAIAGNWSGGGVISLTNDIRENLRCRASHNFAQASSALAISIKCSSDNYRFELSSNVVERRGQISGNWSEASYKVSGTISGRVAGNTITAVARGDSFTSPITLTTNGNRQTVSLTPERTYVISVQIALNRMAAPPATARR